MPPTRTLIEFALLAVPLYYFVLSPILAPYFPSYLSSSEPQSSAWRSQHVAHSSRAPLEKSDSLVIPSRSSAELDELCGVHKYDVRVLSREPLVIYIEDFLTQGEVDEVVELGLPLLADSTIFTGTSETLDLTVRNSTKAPLPRSRLVECIEHRALKLQGHPRDVYIERLWLQRYKQGGHYSHHFDWSGDVRRFGRGRVSSFMVYLGDDGVSGGGTEFPHLRMPADGSWCRFVDCDNQTEAAGKGVEEEGGVTFKPVKGNAVYWENFRADGTGYAETLHAGLPVTKGTKYGLNIWSWYQPGYAEAVAKAAASDAEQEL